MTPSDLTHRQRQLLEAAVGAALTARIPEGDRPHYETLRDQLDSAAHLEGHDRRALAGALNTCLLVDLRGDSGLWPALRDDRSIDELEDEVRDLSDLLVRWCD